MISRTTCGRSSSWNSQINDFWASGRGGRLDALTIELPRLRWWAKVKFNTCLCSRHDMLMWSNEIGTHLHDAIIPYNCSSWRTYCCIKGRSRAFDSLTNVAMFPEDLRKSIRHIRTNNDIQQSYRLNGPYHITGMWDMKDIWWYQGRRVDVRQAQTLRKTISESILINNIT